MSRRLPVRAGILGALVVGAVVASGCHPPDEGASALLVTSGGSLSRIDGSGDLEVVRDLPPGIRRMAAAGRTLVVQTDDERFHLASPAGPGVENVSWRELDVELPSAGFTAGIDVSPDGTSLAVVRAHENADRLELLVVDLATGEATTRTLDQAANGPPSWLGNGTIALEVIGPEANAEVVGVDIDGGLPVVSASRGFALAATPDGATIALADDGAPGIVVRDRAGWWAGEPRDPGDQGLDPGGPDLTVQDVAIDADGSRVAVVYAHGDTPAWTVAIDRLVDRVWERVMTKEIESDVPPTIDWLE